MLSFAPAQGTAKTTDMDSAAKLETFSADHIMSLVPKTGEFLIRSGKGSGKKVSMSMKRSKESPDLWMLTFKNFYRLFIYGTSRGTVQITRIEILDRQKAISFNPSIEFVPSRIAATTRMERSGWTKVSNLASGKNINEGTFTHSLKGVSRTDFETPAGMVDGYLILHESWLDLKYAKLRIHLEAGFSKEKQLIYWRTKSVLKKFLFFGSKTIHEFIVSN